MVFFDAFLCVPRVLVGRIPEYFTGLCTLTMAVERYILIIYPFKADQFLRKRNRIAVYSIITTLCFGFSFSEIAAHSLTFGDKTYEPYDYLFQTCYFFPKLGMSHYYSSLATATVFFLIPASICFFLYVRVGRALARKKRKAGRNRVLTFALLLSCMFWIFLWGLAYLVRILDGFPVLRQFMYEVTICLLGWEEGGAAPDALGTNSVWDIIVGVFPLLPTFSAVMNAMCLLVVCKAFWEPLFALCSRIKLCFC